jgi:hypothetical protein
MKATLLALAAVVCFSIVYAGKSESFLKSVEKHANIYKGAKRGHDEERRCWGAKCECDDEHLTGALLSTIGHVVLTCETYRIYLMINSEWTIPGYYHEACEFMETIGEMYENDTLPDVILSCCEYTEALVAFHCLDSYMTVTQMKIAEYLAGILGIDSVAEKDLMVQHLEWVMGAGCNYIYGSPRCLVMGMTGDPDIETCIGDDEESGSGSDSASDSGSSSSDSSSGSSSGAMRRNKETGNDFAEVDRLVKEILRLRGASNKRN